MRCSPTFTSICASVLLLSVYSAAVSLKEHPVMSTTALHCWQEEEFTVVSECGQCTAFQMKSWPPCQLTGFVEQISCSKSNKAEH